MIDGSPSLSLFVPCWSFPFPFFFFRFLFNFLTMNLCLYLLISSTSFYVFQILHPPLPKLVHDDLSGDGAFLVETILFQESSASVLTSWPQLVIKVLMLQVCSIHQIEQSINYVVLCIGSRFFFRLSVDYYLLPFAGLLTYLNNKYS